MTSRFRLGDLVGCAFELMPVDGKVTLFSKPRDTRVPAHERHAALGGEASLASIDGSIVIDMMDERRIKILTPGGMTGWIWSDFLTKAT